MLGRILSAIRGKPAPTPVQGTEEDDRRNFTRHQTTLETQVRRLNGCSERVVTTVRNVSRGGIKLISPTAIQAGEMVDIEIPGKGGACSTDAALACVIHCQPLEDDTFALGCAFSDELETEDLLCFGAILKEPSESDQRSFARFVCNVKATYQPGDESVEAKSAHVINISTGGIGLLIKEPVANGTLLNLSLSSTQREAARSLLACVVHVKKAGDHEWMVGCNFINDLRQSDLKALL